MIRVVGAVIVSEGLVLCAQRGNSGKLPGLWEFPGGKIEEGESPEDALVREIKEELGAVVTVEKEILTTRHEYEFGVVSLTTFYCQIVAGTLSNREHSKLVWLTPNELHSVEWAPADIPAVEKIATDMA